MQVVIKNDTIFLYGDLDFKLNNAVLTRLKKLAPKYGKINLDAVHKMDYAGAWFLKHYFASHKIICENEQYLSMLKFAEFENFEIKQENKLRFVEQIGANLIEARIQGKNIINFLGRVLIMLFDAMLRPWHMRVRELTNHIKDAGVRAIFIVGLTAFLIGIVLAYQGAVMLERFGASVLVVDIMGIITLREIAPLIAAIVVAGRSASSFAAQIGVMKITEELYAMKTMGFTPFAYVVMPRILALCFVMPVVILCADFISIFGQMSVCNWYLGLNFENYLDRFAQNVDLRHFWVGMVKAPIFGAVIATIGCLRGYEVDGSTESVGNQTTKSVVNAIFWIIALDAAFSVIFTELEI